MKSASLGFTLSVSRWPVHGRRLVAAAVVAFGVAVATAENAVSTLAGTYGTSGFVNATGTAAAFNFTNPSGVVADAAGNLFVTDAVNHVIRKIDPAGVVTTFAGSASGASGSSNGTGTAASFSGPQAIAIDGAGTLYVADTGNHLVRMVTPGAVVTTLAGGGSGSSDSTDGTGATAKFNQPLGIAVDRAGTGGAALNVFVADTQNNTVRQIVVATGATSTLAGSAGMAGFVDDTNANARFSHPDGIASNAAGTTLYVADTFNHRIRRIVITAGPIATVSTLAGSGAASYAEGTGTAAAFNTPTALAFAPDGTNLLVSDTLSQVIRQVTPAGVTTLYAGTGNTAGYANGLASVSRFSVPSGITSTAGGVFVIDTNNKVVRQIAAASAPGISAQPASSVTVKAGETATFTVTASGNPPVNYQWQYSTNSGGSWSNLTNGGGITGAVTDTLAIAGTPAGWNAYQFRVVVSNGVTPPATSNVSTLTVNQAPVITNTTVNFHATLNQAISGAILTASGFPTPSFVPPTTGFPSWASLDTSTGAITGTPTDLTGSPFSFAVTATNAAGTSSPVTFTLTVESGPAISSQPGNQSVLIGQSAVFTVSASSTPAITAYQWEYSTDAGGSWTTLPEGGAYTGTAGAVLTVTNTTTAMSGMQFRVVITNSVGASTSNAATLSVGQKPVFISASATTFVVNQAGAFVVRATGYPTPTYGYSGSFPSWAQLNTATGVISGTPTDTTNSPYTFTLTASNSSGTTAQDFTLNVSATPLTPTLTTQPVSQTIGLNQDATFSIVAAGSPTLTYQWQRYRTGDGAFVSLADAGQYRGATTTDLTITGATAEMNGDLYRVVVTNSLGTATSDSVQLTLTAGNVFSTLAGQAGVKGVANGTGPLARFNAPTALAIDASGNAYVADAANHAIRKVTAAGVVTTVAGTPGTSGSDDGYATAARFNSPSGIAVDLSGNLFVADAANHTIRMISPAGYVTTIAGRAGTLGNVDGNGPDARFAYPSGIAVDPSGNLYVADTLNNKVRKLVPTGGAYLVLPFALTDAVGNPVAVSYPNSIAVDSTYHLYLADTRNSVIRKITAAGVTTTLAGTVGVSGSADGTGSAARFSQPEGIALDAAGNVYVADTANHTVRRVTPAGVVTTVAGSVGQPGSADGAAGTVKFNQPYGVAVDASGAVYVADTFNHAIRRSGSGVAPQITTQPQSVAIRVGQNASFTLGATGTPAPSYQWQRKAAGASDFTNLVNDSTSTGVNSATLTLLAPTEAMSGDRFRVVVNNLVSPTATSSEVTLTVQPAMAAPAIETPPETQVVNEGDTATFSVAATGTGTLGYQWKLNGIALMGANDATLTLQNVQVASSGLYTVTITNPAGSVTSSPAGLTVNSAPVIITPPRAQVATAGTSVTFAAGATGGAGLAYQWRKNGVAIAGATSSTFTLASVVAADAGNYDVVITNGLGSVTSSLAQLTLVAGASAPTFTAQPASQTAVAGSTVTLNAAAAAVPAPTYQWRRNGVEISGATGSSLVLSPVQAGDAGNYDVVITNSAGSITSGIGAVQVIARSYAGIYFGTFSGGLGSFAMYVRSDNTGVFLGYATGSSAPLMSLGLYVNDAGQFSFTRTATDPAAAPAELNGTISGEGIVSGAFSAGSLGSLNGTRSPDSGVTPRFAGFYLAGSTSGAGAVLTIADASGRAFAAVQRGSSYDGAVGTVNTSGLVSVDTPRATITETIMPAAGVISASVTGVMSGSFNGALESALGRQRLANISTRARVSGGDAIAIAGFVISGTESKPVLVRAVGPTLTSYGIAGALPTPKLELYRTDNGRTTLVGSNTGVSTASNSAAIIAAGNQAGAFVLKDNADSAMLVTLPPGLYSAQVSGTGTASGVVLVEVYDLSAAEAGQKLVNISTRAPVGTGENAMIAGVVINGRVPKRVLIRAVGPGLNPYGVPGVLAQPVLTLKTQAGATIATNTGWSTSADAASITGASAEMGAFPLAADDSAMIVTLLPGGYSAQVTGSGNGTGVALVEVYELQ